MMSRSLGGAKPLVWILTGWPGPQARSAQWIEPGQLAGSHAGRVGTAMFQTRTVYGTYAYG